MWVWQNQPPLIAGLCHPHTPNAPQTGRVVGFCPLISSYLKVFFHRPMPRKAKQELSTALLEAPSLLVTQTGSPANRGLVEIQYFLFQRK